MKNLEADVRKEHEIKSLFFLDEPIYEQYPRKRKIRTRIGAVTPSPGNSSMNKVRVAVQISGQAKAPSKRSRQSTRRANAPRTLT